MIWARRVRENFDIPDSITLKRQRTLSIIRAAVTPENSTKIYNLPNEQRFSPLFGPAGQTTKNIITNLLYIGSEDIPKNLQAGRRRVRFFANGVQRSDLPKQGSDFIMWIPSDNEATLQRPHVSVTWPESRAVYSTTQGMKDLERDYPASRGA